MRQGISCKEYFFLVDTHKVVHFSRPRLLVCRSLLHPNMFDLSTAVQGVAVYVHTVLQQAKHALKSKGIDQVNVLSKRQKAAATTIDYL